MTNEYYGTHYRFRLLGASHEASVGVEIIGLPAGQPIDPHALQAFLDRRAPGKNALSSSRQEEDRIEILQGLKNGLSDGTHFRAEIKNTDARPEDYEAISSIPRPGHGDYPAYVKYGRIPPGGGRWSGRMTAPFCIAGGIALQLLAREGIRIEAKILSVGGQAGPDFEGPIRAAAAEGDSVGGIIECIATGLPIGLGDHPFFGLENRIAQAAFAIPGVKGIEFGDGFHLAAMKGSQANDPYRYEEGRVICESNHNGGILGGMSNGMPLIFRLAVKPTPSIGLPQASVDLEKQENVSLQIRGRHDPCIVPRALPVAEAAAAVALYDAWLAAKEDQ